MEWIIRAQFNGKKRALFPCKSWSPSLTLHSNTWNCQIIFLHSLRDLSEVANLGYKDISSLDPPDPSLPALNPKKGRKERP